MATLLINNFVIEFNARVCSTPACIEAGDSFNRGIRVWDNVIVVALVLSLIGVGLTSYKLPASAAFLIISIILAPILGYISYFINKIFIDIIGHTTFDAIRMYFPKTILICTNLHWVALAAFVIGSIALFGKSSEKGQFVDG